MVQPSTKEHTGEQDEDHRRCHDRKTASNGRKELFKMLSVREWTLRSIRYADKSVIQVWAVHYKARLAL